MYDKPYIRLVDTHAESYCSHYDINLLMQKCILVFRTGLTVHAGVIGQRLDIVHLQHFSQFFHFFTAQAVDDTGFALVILDKLDYITVYSRRLWSNLVI